jgi:predicted ArsR family transcriptional regulator
MKAGSICLIIEDAVAIRGILDLFEKSETITTSEVAMTQHISDQAARRLMKLLQKVGIVEHPTATRIILGVPQKVPCMQWRLTTAAKQGEIPSAEALARELSH